MMIELVLSKTISIYRGFLQRRKVMLDFAKEAKKCYNIYTHTYTRLAYRHHKLPFEVRSKIVYILHFRDNWESFFPQIYADINKTLIRETNGSR